jgi:RNA polymerase sigma-70 factor (ECF subfamily)
MPSPRGSLCEQQVFERLRSALRHTPADGDAPGDGFPGVLAAAGKGERWALTELFRAYQPALMRFLRVQEPLVTDRLAGDVWVAVARGLPQFVGDEVGFRQWLYTIARHRLIEHRRRRRRVTARH